MDLEINYNEQDNR